MNLVVVIQNILAYSALELDLWVMQFDCFAKSTTLDILERLVNSCYSTVHLGSTFLIIA